MQSASPDCDVTFIVRTLDDEERIGHVLGRIARYLGAHHLTAEIVVADEGSGDNTVAVAIMLRRRIREIAVLHTSPGCGFRDACQRARGRVIVLADARTDAPLGAVGYALGRLRDGLDVVALGGRYLVMRRTRAWRAFEALVGRRDPVAVETRFLRRARQLGLACTVTHRTRRKSWLRLFAFRGSRAVGV
ncbi:MAG TPA: glycosyltransferase [Polyangia bacterium]|nr:glycosyltransferase [Polyangia bacterium]